MRLSHDPLKISASFDDPNLVSRAGLVPVMSLAERAGLYARRAWQLPSGRRRRWVIKCLGGRLLRRPQNDQGAQEGRHVCEQLPVRVSVVNLVVVKESAPGREPWCEQWD